MFLGQTGLAIGFEGFRPVSRRSSVGEPKEGRLDYRPDGRIGRPPGKCRENMPGKSMPAAFVVTPETAPAPLNVVGEKITVLASGAQTGSYEIFRQAGPEGSGPPPHSHPGMNPSTW
jgi:hypothetical protein